MTSTATPPNSHHKFSHSEEEKSENIFESLLKFQLNIKNLCFGENV